MTPQKLIGYRDNQWDVLVNVQYIFMYRAFSAFIRFAIAKSDREMWTTDQMLF